MEKGFFVDSAKYPERNGDGIARDGKGGVGAGSIVVRDADYCAPVCDHFGTNHLPDGKSDVPVHISAILTRR